MQREIYPCPACGFEVFGEPPGSHEICEVCGWEDDSVQLQHPSMAGGANKLSLIEAQKALVEKLPPSVSTYGRHVRTKNWRPINPAIDRSQSNTPQTGREYFEVIDDCPNGSLYYWEHS